MEKTESVIRRVRKLLEITVERGATEEEAANAAARVHALLAQYNLDLAEVHDSSVEGLEPQEYQDRYNDPWRRALATNVASLFFCRYFYQTVYVEGRQSTRRQRGIKHTFVGKPHNVTVARCTYDYLVKTITRLAGNNLSIYKRDRLSFGMAPSRTEENRHWRSFVVGCSRRLCERLAYLKWERSRGATTTDGTKLPALANLYDDEQELIRRWMEQQGIEVRTVSSKMQDVDAYGFKQGRQAADSINLDAQVEGGGRTHLLTEGS